MKLTHLSHNHFMVSDADAGRLARASGHPLPRIGYEAEVKRSTQWKDLFVVAHKAVENALLDGTLVKPFACERCRAAPPPFEVVKGRPLQSQIQAHHEDYSLPLYIQWLCIRCHKIRHGQEIPRTAESARRIVRRWCASQLAVWRQEQMES